MSIIHIASQEIDSLLLPRGVREGADVGNPTQVSMSRDSGEAKIGVWECNPGGWPVVDRANTEVCVIQSGTGSVTDEQSGEVFQLSAGDILVLPKGWSGRWDLGETLRKVFITF